MTASAVTLSLVMAMFAAFTSGQIPGGSPTALTGLLDNCPADIAVLVDTSGSIDSNEKAELISFMTSLATNQMTVNGNHRLGLARFSSDYEMKCQYVDHVNVGLFTTALATLSGAGSGLTDLGKGINGLWESTPGSCGVAPGTCIVGGPGETAAPNVLLILTDGDPNVSGMNTAQSRAAATAAATAIKGSTHNTLIIVLGISVTPSAATYLQDFIVSDPQWFIPAQFGNLGAATQAIADAICQSTNPNYNLCKSCLERDNQRNYFTDPNDCTRYLQCYQNGTAISMPCPLGMYWNDYVLTCVPDILGNCNNPCSAFVPTAGNSYTWAERVIYPIDDCTYLICDNGYGLPMCCPDGTALVNLGPGLTGLTHYDCQNETASGVAIPPASLCLSTGPLHCDIPWYPTPPTPAPVSVWPNGSCSDGAGNILAPFIDPTDPDAQYYYLLGGVKKMCPDNTAFSLVNCTCEHSGPHVWPKIKEHCFLYLSFDDAMDPWRDYTVHRRETYKYGAVTLAPGASSTAAEFQNGGRLETPGMQTVDYRNDASFCFWYFCQDCEGGLVSNSGSINDWSVRFGLTKTTPSTSALHGDVQLHFPQETHMTTFDAANPTNWIHVCGVLDNECMCGPGCTCPSQFTWSIYKQGTLVQQVPTNGGDIKIAHCPLTFGSDHLYGNFTGFIDEVLICPYAFTAADRNAHMTFNMANFGL